MEGEIGCIFISLGLFFFCRRQMMQVPKAVW